MRSYALMPFIVLTIAIGWSAGQANAEDLGKIGPTYGIAEQDFLKWIKERLEAKQQSGELARLQEEAKQRAVESMKNPPPVPGLTAAEVSRTYYWDPTFVLQENVFDEKGKLLFPAGTRKNPLEVITLPNHLLFFDAREEKQVAKAKALGAHYDGKIKFILVGGSYWELSKKWGIPVYYDQSGFLTKKFGIAHVPALVSQDGLRMRIDEITVN